MLFFFALVVVIFPCLFFRVCQCILYFWWEVYTSFNFAYNTEFYSVASFSPKLFLFCMVFTLSICLFRILFLHLVIFHLSGFYVFSSLPVFWRVWFLCVWYFFCSMLGFILICFCLTVCLLFLLVFLLCWYRWFLCCC